MPTLTKENTAKFFACRSSGMHDAGHDEYEDHTWQGDYFKYLDESGVSTQAYNQQVSTYNDLEDECDEENLSGTDGNNNVFQISVLPQRPRPKPK